MLSSKEIQSLFPVFRNNPGLCYLDTPASSLTPEGVIFKLREYYENYPVNVSRGLYALSEKATQEVENVREKTAQFLGASSRDEIIFTRNTTESLNLLARTLLPTLKENDEIVITAMEHHANFIPWQQLTKHYNLKLKIIPFEKDGRIEEETLQKFISPQTKIFSFVHTSNVFGTVNDAKRFIYIARHIQPNIITILDGAQSAGNIPFNVKEIDCDFFACSGHKMFGPKGVGILWGKKKYLDILNPFLYGGEMISSVSEKESIFKESPARFEAGTPSIGDIIGFGSALDFINSFGKQNIFEHEKKLASLAWDRLRTTFGDMITLFGPDPEAHTHAGIISFALEGIHPHDISQILAQDMICVRAGTHCAMPLHKNLDTPFHATVRIGFSLYNTPYDIDRLIHSLQKAQTIFISSK
ncbi:MAG: cysteine desulfurase [Candidatus Moranbacteria bacterium]|nr:cysteine desulfurase [Candidatus Moranbacteria bacterium]